MTTLSPPTPELLTRLTEIVGESNAIAEASAQEPFLREWRDLYHGKTPLVLLPKNTGDVSRILELANAYRVAIVPQGGNTGLVGGQIPNPSATEIVLSLQRMTAIRSIDSAASYLIAEAGVTLAHVQAAADRQGRLFPLSLASEGSCTIGGNLATNAGGVAVLAYGNARALTLGIEAVLPDGRVWNGLKSLDKDNSGYDLKNLFIGSEGTLGVITAAALRLFPRPAEQATAFAALTSLNAAIDLLELARQHAGRELTAFEFMPRIAIEMVTRHIPGTRLPLSNPHPWYALLELSGHTHDGRALDVLNSVLALAVDRGIVADAAVAASYSQQRDFWKLRESISEAQKPEGGSIKHDISVPVAAIPAFIARASVIVQRLCPGARPVPFGHMGDGNVHYNVSQPPGMDKARFLELWEPMNRAIHDLVCDLSGSISAEHGIGQLKRDELKRVKSEVELDLQRRIKAALDPNGIMNPGKVI